MLVGNLVRLRPPAEADLAVLAAMRNDPALQFRLMTLARPSSLERVRDWIARRSNDPQGVFFVVAEKTSNVALGFCQLVAMDFVHGHAQLGIGLSEGATGKGYGSDALDLLEAYAKATFNLRKIHLAVLCENEGAIALYLARGYRVVGIRKAHFFHGGTYHDEQSMEKLL